MNLLRIKSAIWNFNGQFVTDLIVLLGLALLYTTPSITFTNINLADQKLGKNAGNCSRIGKYGNRFGFGNYSRVDVLHLTPYVEH